MALIRKDILVCNKCGKESESSANVTILGEEFYLCDDCLERLIRWVTTKTEPTTEPTTEITRVVPREKPAFVPHEGRASTYTQWDEYNINKLLDLWGQNYTMRQCMEAFKVGMGSIAKILLRIRKATPGSTLHPYQARLASIDAMRHNNKKDEED